MGKTRIFFTTDIHGSEVCFKKFINAAEIYKANVVILGGDITGKAMIPVFQEGENYTMKLLGEELKVKGDSSVLIGKAKALGYYPYITTREEWVELSREKGKLDRLFLELMVETTRKWIKMAEEKLVEKKVKCLVSPGNDDVYEIDEALNSSSFIINPNEKIVSLNDELELMCLGYSNPTPWKCPRDITEEELAFKIETLMSKASKDKPIVFCIHVPPYGTGIDEAPELDEEMRPKLGPGGQVRTMPVGSKAVREAILKHKPLLGLHGHVHEGRGFFKLGKTLCINPGSEYPDGILRGALIQVVNGKIRDYIFTSG